MGSPDCDGGGVRTEQTIFSFAHAALKPSTYRGRRLRAIVRYGLAGRTFSPFFFVLLVILGAVVVVFAQEEERVSVEPAMARKAATLILARCAVCHTTDLIAQQRLPQERWTVIVEKMVHWGAELSQRKPHWLCSI